MTNRREFLHYTATSAAVMTMPSLLLAQGQEHILKRKIPGSDEFLPVIGLGNSNSFRQSTVC